MRNFEYTSRAYIPSVDLNTLGNTFNTLEQGHKETIKAASDLKTFVSTLDMNEAEDGFKQALVNDIQKTIDDNTLYGNSYAALDDIIAKSGNIAANPAVTGRLRAQAAFKQFENQILSNQELPQDYKDMYLEKNPYYYEDKLDRHGNIIGGTTWKPNSTPTKIIPLSELTVKAISIAAKEKGGSDITRWLDMNGNVTQDPAQAFDGEVYNVVTNQWERLTRDKIYSAIQGLIETTPGAKASLQQDYDVAQWKHDKAVKENNGKIVIDDFTDPNGIALNPMQYLAKRIDPVVEAAQYYNYQSSTKWGDGLKTYKGAMKKNDLMVEMHDNTTNFDKISKNTPITIDYDFAGRLQETKQNCVHQIQELIKDVTGDKEFKFDLDMSKASDSAWDNVFDNAMKARGITDENTLANTKYQYNKLRRIYKNASENYNNIYNQLYSKSEKDKFDFVNRMNNGGDFNPENNIDKKALEIINRLFVNNTQYLSISSEDSKLFNNFIDQLSDGDLNGYKQYGTIKNINGQNRLYISKNNYNALLPIAKLLNNNEGFIIKRLNSYDESDESYANRYGDFTDKRDNGAYIPDLSHFELTNLYKLYNDTSEDTKNTLKQKNLGQQITLDNFNLPGTTFTDKRLGELYTLQEIDEKYYNTQKKINDQNDLSKLMGANFTQKHIYMTSKDAKNGAGTLMEELDENRKLELEKTFKTHLGSKLVETNPGYNAVLGTGLNITIYSKLDNDGEPKGDPITFFAPGLISESQARIYENDINVQSQSRITIGNELREKITLSGNFETPSIGEQSIQCVGNNVFIYSNKYDDVQVNRQQASNIYKAMSEYNNIKDSYKAGMFNNMDSNMETRFNMSLQGIANEIYINTNGKVNIYNQLVNDLNN